MLIVLGKVGAPWGVKGWLRLHSFTDPAENLLDYRLFLLRSAAGERPIEVDEIRPQGKSFVGHIKGCDAREQASLYTGGELLIEQAELPVLDNGSWYWHELIGLEVRNLRDESLGRVVRLMETGANDVLILQGESHEERLVPFVQGRVIVSVDPAAGLIRADWELDY